MGLRLPVSVCETHFPEKHFVFKENKDMLELLDNIGDEFCRFVDLQHAATHCNTLLHTATRRSILQHAATCCNALQLTLQHAATHQRSGYDSVDGPSLAKSCNTHCNTHCNTLQHTATHIATPQLTATHCNTLQHTATHLRNSSRMLSSISSVSCFRDFGKVALFRKRATNYRALAEKVL